MRRLFVGVICGLIAVAAGAQEAQLQVAAEVVKTPIEPEPVPAPPQPPDMTATFMGARRDRIMVALAAPLLRQADVPGRREQCLEAKVFVEANATLPSSTDLMATKLAVLDQCYPAPTSPAPLQAPPVAGQTPEAGTPLQTAAGVPLDLSQRIVFALTLIAVNTAKEAVINEGLGAFADQICTDARLAPYFRKTCDVITIGEVLKDGKKTPLRTLTLKQMSVELREAMRADMDEAVPTLIGDLALQLTEINARYAGGAGCD